MSDAEYRVVVEHKPQDAPIAWSARAFNLAGDFVAVKYGSTAEAAVNVLRDYLRRLGSEGAQPRTLWLDEHGRDAAAPMLTEADS